MDIMGGTIGVTSLGAKQRKNFTSTSPPTDEDLKHLIQGLRLAGQTLAPPQFVHTGWEIGRIFEEIDDPDRMSEPWSTPSFVFTKDPLKQQEKVRCEELFAMPARGSFAKVAYDVLDEEDCAGLIKHINAKGFTPALVNIGGGRQLLEPEFRNGHRVIVDSPELSKWLFEVLKPFLPQELNGETLIDFNERLRVLCYTPGQEFTSHFDGCYRRPRNHSNAGDCSRVTVQLYLHDVPESNGGATTFHLRKADCGLVPNQPVGGSALLFTQDLEHEGSLLRQGLKYTLRTEAMYRRSQD